LAARTFRSEWATESASSEVLDGAGLIGDSIGVADSQHLTTTGTTPGATRFITVAASTELGARAADFPAVPAQRPQLSTETARLLEDTLHPAVRKASARAPSAASKRADRQRAIRHGERPASVAEKRVAAVAEGEHRVAEVVGIINQSFVMFSVDCKIWKWREAICGERS